MKGPGTPLGILVIATFMVGGCISPSSGQKVSPQKPPQRSTSTTKDETNGKAVDTQSNDACPTGDSWCSSLDETEKLALEAITALFHQLDDDKNGNIDLEESNEFLREELKYNRNIENRQKAFHRDDDYHVSVQELWETWIKSEVHNWTVDQTLDWLKTFVGLPQHQEKFLAFGVNGTVLPILAVNHNNFLTTAIGIKDSITKQKIVVKAMDVVLFGPPRDNTNYVKDFVLTTALAVAVIGCMIVYKRYKESLEDLNKMTRHMAELSKAEKSFKEVLQNLEDTESNEHSRQREEVTRSDFEGEGPEELVKLRDENQVLRNELHRAEAELQDKCWVAPHALQHWLQYTYELELKSYNKKKSSAERQLKQAKEACDKLKKKRSSLMGAFVSTHGRSIDDVDKAILEARTALTEITHELQERMHRWKQIESLVGCQIMNNNGIQYLDNLLKVYGKPSMYSTGPGSVISNSQDDMDDDTSSIYSPSTVSGPPTSSATMARSRSVNSMMSLRDRTISREPSSQDSSNGETDLFSEAPDLNGAKDRRVTFRADRRAAFRALVDRNGRNNGPTSFDSLDNHPSRMHQVPSRVLQTSNSVDIPSSNSEEETQTQIKQTIESVQLRNKQQPSIPKSISISSVIVPVKPVRNTLIAVKNSVSPVAQNNDDQAPIRNTLVALHSSLPQNEVPVKSPKHKVWNAISHFVRNTDKKVWPIENGNPNKQSSQKQPKLKGAGGSFKQLFQKSKSQLNKSNSSPTQEPPLPDCVI